MGNVLTIPEAHRSGRSFKRKYEFASRERVGRHDTTVKPKMGKMDSEDESDEAMSEMNHPVPIADGCRKEKDEEWTKKKIIKNLIVVSSSFLLLFAGYSGISSLQSTMNGEEGIGVISQAILYIFVCISALFLPKYVISKLGCKATLILAIITYLPYVASNFYSTWMTMIPSAIILGTGASLLWSSQSVYINELSYLYSSLGADDIESVTVKFFGFSGALFMTALFSGNLISFFVLQKDHFNLTSDINVTGSCGFFFCDDSVNADLNPNLLAPTIYQRYLLVGILVALAILSIVLTVFFLDPLPRDQRKNGKSEIKAIGILYSTLRLTKDTNHLLLMSLVFYVGLEQGFYCGDFTQAYVACSWGVYYVGLVTISNSLASSVSSFLAGSLVKYVGRLPIFFVAAVSNFTAFVLLYKWTPSFYNPTMLFVISTLWGFCTGIFWTQTRALYGVLFKHDEEAGFANYYLWNSLGYFLSFCYSKYLCLAAKVYIAACLFGISVLTYVALEIKLIQK